MAFFIDKNWSDNLGDPLKFYSGLNYYTYEELEVIKNNMLQIQEYLNSKKDIFFNIYST
ncbi:hypothetical protein [Brachyspira hyodysenteriae]|uniref:hypothetical protein n=1 Tax=Brachyspira hyodysenteriae TaxID=159 RepID=UPI0022CDE326|nr:hypothetical protein [Brachyspira hyodysenteriae]MDA0079472.1 hypothetical protein [Brachyspira hyodysenteriae]